MNKPEFVNAVAAKAGLSAKDAEKAVNAMISTITNELAIGGEVILIGFGKFHVVNRAERKNYHIKTGEQIIIPAHKAPHFAAGKILKDAVK